MDSRWWHRARIRRLSATCAYAYSRMLRSDGPQRARCCCWVPVVWAKPSWCFHAIDALLRDGVPGQRHPLCIDGYANVLRAKPRCLCYGAFQRTFDRPEAPALRLLRRNPVPEGWVHLKSLVDSHRGIRFVATGSAAAALKHKKRGVRGAGRFTEFALPPPHVLYLRFLNIEDALIVDDEERVVASRFSRRDLHALNEAFIAYVNFGGLSRVRVLEGRAPQRPPLHQERHHRQSAAARSAKPVRHCRRAGTTPCSSPITPRRRSALKNLSKSSGVTKPTINKYLSNTSGCIPSSSACADSMKTPRAFARP